MTNPLAAFVRSLSNDRSIAIDLAFSARPSADAEVDAAIMRADGTTRLCSPAPLPACDLAGARAAFAWLHRACVLALHRDLGAEEIEVRLGDGPGPGGPVIAYSVDLAFRHLPGLHALVRRASPGDPLVARLLDAGRAWPLSSVGMEGVGKVDDAAIIAHPALGALYVDRIIESGDRERARSSAGVRNAIATALGGFPESCPAIAAAIRETP